MWEAWTLSKSMGIRPSEVYSIEDRLAAYCFDRAVTMWGLHVEQAVRQKVEAAKTRQAAVMVAQRTMDRFLYSDAPNSAPGRFRDPAAR